MTDQENLLLTLEHAHESGLGFSPHEHVALHRRALAMIRQLLLARGDEAREPGILCECGAPDRPHHPNDCQSQPKIVRIEPANGVVGTCPTCCNHAAGDCPNVRVSKNYIAKLARDFGRMPCPIKTPGCRGAGRDGLWSKAEHVCCPPDSPIDTSRRVA